MLQFFANNSQLDLGTIKGVSLSFNPGIFELDSFVGSFSIPFTIPANEINNPAFGFLHKLSAKSVQIAQVDAQLWHSGILMLYGTIRAEKFSDKEISCTFYTQNGEIFNLLNQKNLNQHDFGGEQEFVEKETYDPDDDDFCLYPVKNPNYFADTIYAADTSNRATIQNNYVNGSIDYDVLGPCIVTPFPWLHKVLKYLFQAYGFNFTDSFFTQADYKTINVFNTVNMATHYFVEIYGNKFIRWEIETYNLANHLPAIPSADFLKAIQTFFNVCFYFSNRKARVVDKLAMIQATDFDNISSKIIEGYSKTPTGLSYSGLAFNILRDSNDQNVADLQHASDYAGITIAAGDVYNDSIRRFTLLRFTSMAHSRA